MAEREIVRRWTEAFENLISMWDVFNQIHVLDSSTDTVRLAASKAGMQTHTARTRLQDWTEAIGA